MKNIFKKNSIIITALAIMIVIAGYLSFTNRDAAKEAASDGDSVATSGTDVTNEDLDSEGLDVATNTTTDTTTTDTTDTTTTDTDTTDTTTTDTDTTDTNTTDTTTTDENAADTTVNDELGSNDISDADILADATKVSDNGELNLEDGTPGDAVLASASVDGSYFDSVKLKREQSRASNKATLLEIIQSADATKESKQDATESMLQMMEISDKEKAAEMLLGAKGFEDSIVFIVDDTADVVVNSASLTDQQLAIIESVVKNETGISAAHIEILPTVVSE